MNLISAFEWLEASQLRLQPPLRWITVGRFDSPVRELRVFQRVGGTHKIPTSTESGIAGRFVFEK